MDKSLHTQLDIPTVNPLLFGSAEESIGWQRRPIGGLRLLDDDDLEEDDWTEDEELGDEDDFEDDEEWEDDDELDDDDDDDFEDDDFDDDFEDDDFEDDADDYEYEYRGDPGWDDGDDDEYNLLGTRFASLLDDPPAGPKRFRDREGMSRGDKRPKKSHRPRVAKRSQDEIENDDD